jgi:hypothetical protein
VVIRLSFDSSIAWVIGIWFLVFGIWYLDLGI